MLSDESKLIEDFGLYFEQSGLARSLGRIYGLLLMASEPMLSLEAIAERLNMAKASASTGVRTLVAMHLIEKGSLPADRRDYYFVETQAHQRYLQLTLSKLFAFNTLIHRAAQLEGLDAGAHARLENLDGLYTDLAAHLERFFEEKGAKT